MSTQDSNTLFNPCDPSTYPLPNLAGSISGVPYQPVHSSMLSDVYTGYWTVELGTFKVALKVVRIVGGKDKQMLRQFAREVRVWNSFSHPNILLIHGLCFGPWPFPAMVSLWCELGDINEYIRIHSEVGNPNIQEIRLASLIHVLRGLAYLHNNNVIHADIKGANVIMSDAGVAQLCDFGLSVIVAVHSQSLSAAKGTLLWMAPELMLEDKPRYSVESDVWAFGCLCVEVFTAKNPWHGINALQLPLMLHDGMSPLRDHDLDREIILVISFCCRKQRWARPAVNALELILQLQLLSTTLLPDPYAARAPTVAYEVETARNTLQGGNVHDPLFWSKWPLKRTYDNLLRNPASIDTLNTWSAAVMNFIEEMMAPAQVQPSLEHPYSVRSIAYMPDGERIVSGCVDGAVRVWDVKTGAMVGAPMTGHSNWVRSVAVSPDGSQIASGSNDKTIRLWNVDTGAEIGRLKGHTDQVRSVAFSPHGARIVSGSDDNTIRVWDITSRETVVGPIQGHMSTVLSVAYSPDGFSIVSGSWDKSIRLWNAATGEGLWRTDASTPVFSVTYSSDGNRIVAGCLDGSVLILDAETGAIVRGPLTGHSNMVESVAWSPDGTKIASGSFDCTVWLWDAETGKELDVLRGHHKWVGSVAFSPDGKHIASASYDNTVRIWDATGGWKRLE